MDSLGLTARVLFSGGAEFSSEHDKVDRSWMELSGVKVPRVVLLPIAITDHLVTVIRTARRHFNRIGVQLEVVRASGSGESSADSARLRPLTDALEDAHVLYLTDGNPIAALAALRTGKTEALLHKALTTGVAVVACGASAMALCEFVWDGAGWELGLGLVRGIAVLPHYERIAARFPPERLGRDLPESMALVGIEDATALLLEWPSYGSADHLTGAQARVIGADAVTLYHAQGLHTYADGATFQLPAVQLSKG